MQYIFLVSLVLLTGCSDALVRVMPYEKEYFAQDKMSLSPLAERAEQESHIFLIREASAGGDSSFQGGCGCR
ncbi:DUF4266 domain-containing protein [uncultured Sulfurimonas sp.]|jgi:hypothetical protein|uniref:DUF4266 domain-containing protein n=1 Tax=uncultured Sulfurimonas sp. TaxID=291845 RepID=UPI0032B1B760